MSIGGSPASRARMLGAVVALLLVLGTSPRAFAQFQFNGQTVGSVTLRPDAKIDEEAVRRLVSVEAGKPLSIRDVQSSIDRLYASGDFRDIRVDAAPGPAGLDVAFILSLAYRVGNIDIEGAGDNNARARRELTVRIGEVLSLNAVDRSAVGIQRMLARRGFLDATVDPETKFIREENRADIVFHVTPGPEAKISAIQMTGSLAPYTAEQLIAHTRLKPGDTFRPDRARSGADRVRSFLARNKYRKAEVRYTGEAYDRATHTAVIHYETTIGPIVRVTVSGVSHRSVRRLLPFHGDEEYSEDVIARAADAIVLSLQRRGHFLAAVDTEEKLQGNEWVINYVVNPGRIYRLSSVVFEGNSQISAKRLSGVVSVSPGGGVRSFLGRLFRRPSGVTQPMLNADRDALEAFYRLEGFTQPVIGTPVAHPQADGSLVVVFPIKEGPRTIVSAVRTEGNTEIPSSKLPSFELHAGGPLNPQSLTNDVIALQSFYSNRGYAEIQVAPAVNFTPDKTGAEVIYRITEGPKVAIGELTVRGNTYTHSSVVLKKISLRKGDPFSYRAMLEAQRDLYRLGIFQRVDLLPEQAGTSIGERDVVVQVEEGQNLTVAGALGYSTDQGARGTASISHRNLFGTARYLGLEARISQRENRYILTYREPFILNYDIPTQLTLFRSQEHATSVRDAGFRRIGTFIEASRVIGLKQRVATRYEYRVTKCVEGDLCRAVTQGIPIPGVLREDQEIQISSITPTYFWDSRDDPVNPTRGLFASSALEYAFPLRQAETNFLKLSGQSTWYLSMSSRTQLAVSGRLGLVDPLRGSGPGSIVPISERFFAGGETTHRAFQLDSLGIEGQTLVCLKKDGDQRIVVPCSEGGDLTALGGNAMVLANAELRFPIFSSLAGALFVDAGNVWRDLGDVRFSEIRYGVGTGIRYLTPVGPLRVDIGFKLDRKSYEDPFAVFLTLGFPF